MTKYSNVRSTIKPEAVVMDDYSVWVYSNIQEVSYMDSESGVERTEYEYDMEQYTKDEYILKTNDDITDLLMQIASVEVEAGNLELESINEAFQGQIRAKMDADKKLDL